MEKVELRVSRIGDPPVFPEISGVIADGTLERISILERGTVGGNVALYFFVTMPDGIIASFPMTGGMLHMIHSVVTGACKSWGEEFPKP